MMRHIPCPNCSEFIVEEHSDTELVINCSCGFLYVAFPAVEPEHNFDITTFFKLHVEGRC